MTLVWQQVNKTSTYDRGRWSGSHSYIVYDDANASILIIDLINAAGAAGVQVFGAGTETTLGTYLRFVGQTFTPIEASNKQWNAEFQFESIVGDGATITAQDTKTETEVGFTSIEVDIQSELRDVYRKSPTMPSSNALISNPNITDIAGTPYYTGKDPVTAVGHLMRISVRNVVNGRPNYSGISAAVGKRNSAAFTFGASGTSSQNLTCSIGTLLFVGASSSRIGPNQYEVNFEFAYDDKLYHLQQVAMTDVDGVKIVLKNGASTTPSVSNPWYAEFVYFKQPFPDTDTFAALSLVTT